MNVQEISVSRLLLDPARFQYKIVYGKDGNTGSLSGVDTWNDYLGGVILVWRCPETSNVYVINGHNRVALAKRLGVEQILCRLIDVTTPSRAREIGALTNIAEGMGNVIDTAKFFRNTAHGIDYLKKFGINTKLKMVADGLSISNLHKMLFDLTIQGELPTERAVILGSIGVREQLEVFNLIQRLEGERKKVTNDTVQEIVNRVKDASNQQASLLDLMGYNDAAAQERELTKVRLVAEVRKILTRNKKLYSVVAINASQLELIGNHINASTTKSASQTTATILQLFEQLKGQTSPVSAAIAEAVDKVIAGEDEKTVLASLAERLTVIIPALLK